MRTLRVISSVLALLSVPISVSAQQPQAAGAASVQVAVMPLSGLFIGAAAQQKALAEVFRTMVITELAESGRLRLVERQQIDDLIEAQKINLSAMTDAQAIRIGEILGAQYMVTGAIVISGNEARLDLRLIDIETTQTLPPPFKEAVHPDKLLTLVNRVAADFGSRMHLKARVEEIRVPPIASLTFSRGLDYERRGKKQEAAQMYRKVLELFPQHPHARAALQRVN